MAKGIRSQRMNYVEDTGSVNNLSVALDPPLTTTPPLGFVLRVRIGNTNTTGVRINTGAGIFPVRKMDGSDVQENDLPLGAIVTLVFDGAVFQLSNFGGVPVSPDAPPQIFQVKVPYAVDTGTPNSIVANFTPPITELEAGDLLMVKISNSVTGASTIRVNNMAPIDLRPNGGGENGFTLQGDLHDGDVNLFFFDGLYFWFQPNPEVDAPVTYTIGPSGQHFTSVANAMLALRRKVIGAQGLVILHLVQGIFYGPISVQHPGGDRIVVRGTMIGPRPTIGELAMTGAQAADAVNNRNLLRLRYGTEIRIPDGAYGVTNNGPGMVSFEDLLITGDQIPAPGGTWGRQHGIRIGDRFSVIANNVAVWGAQIGFLNYGTVICNNCIVSASVQTAYDSQGVNFWGNGSVAIGGVIGFGGFNATVTLRDCFSSRNLTGIDAQGGTQVMMYTSTFISNDVVDTQARTAANITRVFPGTYGTSSPPVGVVGNFNAIVVDYWG